MQLVRFMEPKTYSQAGVNVAKAEAFVNRLKSISRRAGHDKLWPGAGGYAAVYPLDASSAVALTTDGVGTKLLVALEENDLSTIGIDLVAMCANDLICVGARPAAFLDYYATGKLDDGDADQLMTGIVNGCDMAGMLLIGGETAEMPDLYRDRHFDMAGFAVGLVSRIRLLTADLVKTGQTVIGVASSGIHSNGLSLARRVIDRSHPMRNDLLTPTKIYSPPMNLLLDRHPESIAGIAHITGGGWRNLLRLNAKVGFEIDNPIALPEIFKEIAKTVEPTEMYSTFNMGMGLAVIVNGEAQQALDVLSQHGFDAKVVGTVNDNAGHVVVKGAHNSKTPIELKEKTK